jgi:hypothetical protein
VDGFVLVFLTYLQLELFADEGVQEHFAYLQAFAKAIFCFAVKALKPLFGTHGVTHLRPELR